MPFKRILKEVDRLKQLSVRLDKIASEHPSITEALLPISSGILGMATVLHVLVISKSKSPVE